MLFEAGLGAGKTTFAKGIAKGLGISETITSPTYTLISEYEGEFPLYHIDLYRLEGEEYYDELGLRDILSGQGISLIEWSEKLGDRRPSGAVNVKISIGEDSERIIEISGLDE